MNKKLTLITIIILVAALFAACLPGMGGGANIDDTPLDPAGSPWLTRGERLVYQVERYTVSFDGGNEVNRTVIGRGTQIVTTILEDGQYTITTEWSLTHLNGYGEYTDITDTITTVSVVFRNTLRTVSSHRVVRVHHTTGDNIGQIDPSRSHDITVVGLTSTFAPYGLDTSYHEVREFPAQATLCNDALFESVRRLRDLGTDRTAFVNVQNPFDFHRNNIRSHRLEVSTVSSEPVEKPTLLANPSRFLDGDGNPANFDNLIYTNQIRIAIAGSNSGPAITAWFAAHTYNDGTHSSRRLLIEYVTHTVNIPDLNSHTRIRYRLQEVSWIV